MEFRSNSVAIECNSEAREYLTKNIQNVEVALKQFEELNNRLGNVVESYPYWHPILTRASSRQHISSISSIDAYRGIDHTRFFVRGFITCPYNQNTANNIVENVNAIDGLKAYRLDNPLYNNGTYPVVVEALEVECEADGTIRSRDALLWSTLQAAEKAKGAECGETWWNMRSSLLGEPHGARSSLFVNQHTGGHMRKILETLNNSGIYGPVKESSLEMFTTSKRKKIGETLIQAAFNAWDKAAEEFEFELRGEICKAEIKDTFHDGEELSIRVSIGVDDLQVFGFHYPKIDIWQTIDPTGKQKLAKKFL